MSKREMGEILDGKSSRTIQRSIATLNSFLINSNLGQYIQYDKSTNKFLMVYNNDQNFTAKQVLLIGKILLSTRSLSEGEISLILDDQVSKLSPSHQEIVKQSIKSEYVNYNSNLYNQNLMDTIWDINKLTYDDKVLEIEYSNAKNRVKHHIVKPLYITFSEFYFYLIGLTEDFTTLIFRIDRILDYRVVNKRLKNDYSKYLSEGELKKRIYFMYGGKIQRVQFEFKDGVIESVIDRFPTAKLLKKDYLKNHFIVEIEVVGDGILMWLLSQGSKVRLLSPQSLVDSYQNEIKKIYRDIVGE